MVNFIKSCRYRSKWYNRLDNDTCLASGIHGQWLIVDGASEIVIAKTSSQPEPSGDTMDHLNLAAFDAIAAALR